MYIDRWYVGLKGPDKLVGIILTWHRPNPDHSWGWSWLRPLHCTSVRLTLAIITNVNNSGVQFLVVGDCVRAVPLIM